MEKESRTKVPTADRVDQDKYNAAIKRRLQYFLVPLFVLIVVLVIAVGTALGLSLQARKKERTIIYQVIKPSETPSTDYQRSRENGMQEQLEHIEVVGDGHRFLKLERGSRLCHWKQSTRTGKVKLKHHSFIIIHVSGLYRVYGQYAVFNPPGAQSNPSTVSVLLMQNRNQLSMSLVEHCKRLCTRSFSKTVKLQKGDKLSLQSGTGGMFKVSSKFSYFGINLLRRNDVSQVNV